MVPALLACGVLASVQPARADLLETPSLRSKPALLRMSYEVLDIGPSETMGLAGVHYLVNTHPGWYVGASGFGALEGERGGFFTAGFTVGTGMRFASKWLLDAGLFVGGGGGGSAPQGGGLMLRPHVGISHDVASALLGVGVSHVEFPDGGIGNTQLVLTLGIPFDVYYGRASDAGKIIDRRDLVGLALKHSEWLATYGEYRPGDKARTTEGDVMNAMLGHIGFEYRRYTDARRYYFIETAGAMAGESDGYGELLAGVGYRIPLTDRRLYFTTGLAAGGAGGGRVDTGGGLVGKVRVGLDYIFTSALKLGLEGGRITSAGSFDANFYNLSLGYRLGDIGASARDKDSRILEDVRLAKWRFAAVHHTNLNAARKSASARDLSMLGLKIEKFLTDSVYLTGQAYGAYAGGAGGYAIGLIGAGQEIPLRKDGRLSFNAELAIGAAGGGGMDTGGGMTVQPVAGLAWRFDRQLAARLEAGRVIASDGRLNSNLIGLGLTYEFSRPEYRHE